MKGSPDRLPSSVAALAAKTGQRTGLRPAEIGVQPVRTGEAPQSISDIVPVSRPGEISGRRAARLPLSTAAAGTESAASSVAEGVTAREGHRRRSASPEAASTPQDTRITDPVTDTKATDSTPTNDLPFRITASTPTTPSGEGDTPSRGTADQAGSTEGGADASDAGKGGRPPGGPGGPKGPETPQGEPEEPEDHSEANGKFGSAAGSAIPEEDTREDQGKQPENPDSILKPEDKVRGKILNIRHGLSKALSVTDSEEIRLLELSLSRNMAEREVLFWKRMLTPETERIFGNSINKNYIDPGEEKVGRLNEAIAIMTRPASEDTANPPSDEVLREMRRRHLIGLAVNDFVASFAVEEKFKLSLTGLKVSLRPNKRARSVWAEEWNARLSQIA